MTHISCGRKRHMLGQRLRPRHMSRDMLVSEPLRRLRLPTDFLFCRHLDTRVCAFSVVHFTHESHIVGFAGCCLLNPDNVVYFLVG